MPNPTPRAILEKFDCVIRVDDRAGSKDLAPYLAKLGLTTRLERLPAGDIEIIGIDGTVVLVEYKLWGDVLACVRSGRFAEQLRGMRREAHVSWLLIEGGLRVDAKGGMETLTDRGWRAVDAGITAPELDSWLLTMAQCGGALLWRTTTPEESALWVRALYYWWTYQNWADHRAHQAWFVPPPLWENPYAEPPLALKVACQLPGIGTTRGTAIVDAFGTEGEYPSVEEIIGAGTVKLASVPGVGKVTAAKVWDAVRTRERRLVKRSRVQKGTKAGESR